MLLADPASKAAAARLLHPAEEGDVDVALDAGLTLQLPGPLPGRTGRPLLVAPSALKRRSPFTPEGRAALLHAVAHIELNAIKTVHNEDQPIKRLVAPPLAQTARRWP